MRLIIGLVVGLVLCAVSPAFAADEAFRVQTSGFKFRNYANNDEITNLTPEEMVRLFGPAVNARGDGSEITLTPAAEEWMDWVNEAINIGHCEGLAVLACLFHIGESKQAEFGAATTHALELKDNEKLQREIAMWWTTQLCDTTRAQRLKLAPNECVDILRKSTPPTSPEKAYTLAIWMPDHTAGHAITPYAVVDVDEAHARIMVYDNNYPDQERFIEVDREANTWSYSTQVNPTASTNAYTGDAETKSLELTPCSVRLQKQHAAFLGDAPFSSEDGLEKPSEDSAKEGDDAPDDDDEDSDGAGEAGSAPESAPTTSPASAIAAHFAQALHASKSEKKYATGTYFVEIALTGAGADLLIKDEKGRRIGSDHGKPVNEIPGAEIIRVTGANEIAPGEEEPRYRLPGGVDYLVSVIGTAKEPRPVQISCINRGTELVVEDVTVDEGQTDTVYFSQDGTRVAYLPTGEEHPTLTAGYSAKGPDFEISAHGVETSPGAMVELEIVPKTGCAKVQVHGSKEPATVEVDIERIATEGVSKYANNELRLEPNDAAYFHFAVWKGADAPISVNIDKGGNGKIDTILKLANQPKK